MEIFFGILSVIALLFCSVVLVSRTIFVSKMKLAERGMTGKQIEEITGYKLHIYKVEGSTYYAMVYSKISIFRYRLVFYNGELISKSLG